MNSCGSAAHRKRVHREHEWGAPDCRHLRGLGRRIQVGKVRLALTVSPAKTVRQYLYIEQLAACTPWTPDAIRTMIARGIFKLGVHYFKPHGPNSRPIFSWDAIVRYIEGDEMSAQDGDRIPLADGTVIDLNEAAAKAHRLRG